MKKIYVPKENAESDIDRKDEKDVKNIKAKEDIEEPFAEEKELAGRPSPEEMEKINRYTRRPFQPEEIYAFSVILCDNEVDRDLEQFSFASLKKLAELFQGKTGIYNHTPDAKNQRARIYECHVEEVPGRKNELGEAYCRLKARAYLPRGKENESLILALESGIQKEVSVGCAVEKQICSVCGADMRRNPCGHRKGERYNGELCAVILENPVDAYEWSFVAIPAQREAGVVKEYCGKEVLSRKMEQDWMKADELLKQFHETEEGLKLTKEDCRKISIQLKRLEKEAEAGRTYCREIKKSIRRLGGLVFPQLEEKMLERMTENLSLEELKSFEKTLMHTAEEKLPLQPQLGFRAEGKKKAPSSKLDEEALGGIPFTREKETESPYKI